MVRVRFAPSPTGNIHIGNVRAALFNYIFAKKHNGKLILRLEDTDLERSTEESAHSIIEDLEWLGIKFDEGPHVGGDYGPYKQTERLNIYMEYANKLLANGKAEKDFSHLENDSDKDKTSYAIRLKAGGKKVILSDLVYGEVEKEIDDFIIMKSNGIPTYHFAVVVDDHLMKISHVIRGKDHLDNTFKHILIQDALGFDHPIYAHYSLTYGLSKRDQSKSIKSLREKGYLPQAIINIAMLLGWSPKDENEKFNIFDKLNEFDPKDFTKANSNFDEEKFNWLAGQYIREADLDRLVILSLPFLEKKGFSCENNDFLKSIIDIARAKIKCLSELVEHVDFFFQDITYESDEVKLFIKKPESQTVLKHFLLKVKENPNLTENNFKTFLNDVQKDTNVKGKNLFMPVRIALTGKMHGSDMSLIAPILGRETCIKRLEEAINN
ncbi:MAG: glutamate--tRNA ligase [Spirochaetota bacterium]|nr:glutamate--tRNA ligase [Spirochaetota bacterium]